MPKLGTVLGDGERSSTSCRASSNSLWLLRIIHMPPLRSAGLATPGPVWLLFYFFFFWYQATSPYLPMFSAKVYKMTQSKSFHLNFFFFPVALPNGHNSGEGIVPQLHPHSCTIVHSVLDVRKIQGHLANAMCLEIGKVSLV